jgi:hypothetical protein
MEDSLAKRYDKKYFNKLITMATLWAAFQIHGIIEQLCVPTIILSLLKL